MKLNPLETTPRQQKFLKIYKETKDKDYAAQEAWPELPPRRRKTAMSHVLTAPRVAQHLVDCGLGITKAMKVHAKALTAKKTIFVNGMVDEVDNTEAQLKAVEMAYKLHGLLSSREIPTETNVTVNIDPQRLAEVATRLEAINSKMIHSNVTDAEVTGG